MTNPLVSICIPTFNGEKYIAQALESALNQNYRPLEIIISDDESNDNTLTIIKQFSNITNINIAIFNHTPSGIGENWNNCIKKANGKYIKFLFQDDTLEQNCIKEMMDRALEDDKIGLVFCRRYLKVESGNEKNIFLRYGELHRHWSKGINNVQSGKLLLRDLKFLTLPRNKIGEPTAVLIKTECINKVGWFSNNLKQSLDYEFYYRLFKYYDIGFVDKKLITFRFHQNQASSINSGLMSKEIIELYMNYVKDLFWYLHPKIRYILIKSLLKLKIKSIL